MSCTGGGTVTINGIAGGRDGRFIVIKNTGGCTITLANNVDASPNTITGISAGNVTLSAGDCAMLVWESTNSKWHVVIKSP